MLIRRKSSTDDEYHHEDLLGNFGVITSANGVGLSSNVYDAFVNAQYVANNARIAQPVVCYKAMSEPGLLTGSGGRGVVVPSRGFQVMGKKPAPAKKHPCKKAPTRGPYTVPDCLSKDNTCESDANYWLAACIAATAAGSVLVGIICGVVCAGAETGVLTGPCIWCLRGLGGGFLAAITACFAIHRNKINACNASNNRCINTGYWY